MFNSVPKNYDLINKLITWGLDKKWRRAAAEKCLEFFPCRILDICCGTGDLAYAISYAGDTRNEIIALDYSPLMLEFAKRKFQDLPNQPEIIKGDASQLPFPDDTFDCVGISFAFRNLTYRNPKIAKHLSEIYRILKHGGRFIITESSQPDSTIIRKLFHLYLRLYVATVGQLISDNKGAYKYLAVSATNFHTPEEIGGLLINAGFQNVDYRAFVFGAAGLHVATK
ncbi:ubiquinone/menaquinone biosynthesis methyltransferase [Chloroflexota bacterium]